MLDQRPAERGQPAVPGPDDGQGHRRPIGQGTSPPPDPLDILFDFLIEENGLDRHDLRPPHRGGHEPGPGAALVLDRLRRLGAGDRRPAAARASPSRGASARFPASWASTSASAACSAWKTPCAR